MGKAQRDKGCRFERSLVNVLKAHGFDAVRVPLSGSATGFKGDIKIFVDDKVYRVECKKRGEGGGFKSLYNWIEGSDVLIVGADRMPALVVMRIQDWIGAMGGSYED